MDDCIARAKVRPRHAYIRPAADVRADSSRPAAPSERRSRRSTEPSRSALPWFDPQSIRAGLVGGEEGGGQPVIWIDTNRGVFYYMCSD